MNVKILSATHKPYPMPEDEMYIPVQVNCAANGHFKGEDERYAFDDTGDNISVKNPYYCELTALYWGWKNRPCDYMGLVHYRRYLKGSAKGAQAASGKQDAGKKWSCILSGKEAGKLLDDLAGQGTFVILPRKRYYMIETLYSHYAHSHHEADLTAAAGVIHEYYPDYTEAFTRVMKRTSSHMFNMCIMRRDILDDYCSWLFEVLERIEERLDISGYTDFDKRVFGRLSELLLDVWISKNGVSYHELPMINLEGESWPRKILTFIRRKIKPEHDDSAAGEKLKKE